jgi:type VI protein secretion system component VasF
MSHLESVLSARFPSIRDDAMSRLIGDEQLFDTCTHRLRNGLTKEHARAILMFAIGLAGQCGLKLALSADERKLLAQNFDL